MKNNVLSFVLSSIVFLLLSSCGNEEAVFNLNAQNFDHNAVIGVYAMSSSKPLVLENIKNAPQTFKIIPEKAGYARLVINSVGERDFWIYLGKGTYELELNAGQNMSYPVTGTDLPQGKEIIEFYKLEAEMSESIRDSLKLARKKVEDASRQTLEQALKVYHKWEEQAGKTKALVIEAFSKRYPESLFTIFLIEHYGAPGSDINGYLSIINSLGPDVRNSAESKKMIREFNRLAHLQTGAKMASISGKDPSGLPFDVKVLKKVNLFICWLSYNNDSRKNNVHLVELYEKYKNRDVQFISISFDRYEKWWKAVIKDDGLQWPQYADLLGAKSPNPGNLSNYKAPYMFITDQSGTILSNDVQIGSADFEIENRLESAASIE